MNRFTKVPFKTRIFQSLNYSMILFIAIIAAFIYLISTFSNKNAANESDILNDALIRDIIHCYSIEGAYPPSLEYLEEKYGLTYDHERFIVDYQPIANNIMPGVTVIERTAK